MYNRLAAFYDAFTENVDYAARARYFDTLIERFGKGKGILLDLACGTGSLSFEMEQRGYDVIGVDNSEQMLDAALEKKLARGSDIMFLGQDMQALDLFGTITACICALDSLNHLPEYRQLLRTFQRVSLFTEPGGVFIFDVNTAYKHTKVLGNNAYIYENEACFLAWQNEVCEDKSVNIYLDFFTEENGVYVRESESFTEYYYSDAQLQEALHEAGFALCAVYDDLSFEAPGAQSERKVFIAKKL